MLRQEAEDGYTELWTHILFRRSTLFHWLIKMSGVNNVQAQALSLSLGDALRH